MITADGGNREFHALRQARKEADVSGTTRDNGEIEGDGGTVREFVRQPSDAHSTGQRSEPSHARPPWQRPGWKPRIPRPSLYVPRAERPETPPAQRPETPPRRASVPVATWAAAFLVGVCSTSPVRQWIGGFVRPDSRTVAPVSLPLRLLADRASGGSLVMGGRHVIETVGLLSGRRRRLAAPNFDPCAFASPSGNTALTAVGIDDGNGLGGRCHAAVMRWNLVTGNLAGGVVVQGCDSADTRFALTTDGRTVAGIIGGPDHGRGGPQYIGLWDARTGVLTRRIDTASSGSGPIDRIAFSPNGRWLVWGDGGRLGGRDMRTGRIWQHQYGRVSGLASMSLGSALCVSADSGTIATSGAEDGTVLLSVLPPRGPLRSVTLPPPYLRVRALAFEGGGHLFAAWQIGPKVSLWDVQTGQSAGTVAQNADYMWCALGSTERSRGTGGRDH